MNKLRVLGLFVIIIGIVMFLSTAFQWKEYIRDTVVFSLSLLFLYAYEKAPGGKPKSAGHPSQIKTLLIGLLQLFAFTFILILAAAVIVLLSQRAGISSDNAIYIMAGVTCLVGLGVTAWSFREPPAPTA